MFKAAITSLACVLLAAAVAHADPPAMKRHTTIAIDGPSFLINGKPTYAGRTFRGMKIEGLLLNSRMVQGIFDDRNPETRKLWDYPDGPWDAERNTREFIAAMPAWREHGLLSFTINFQGGSPQGYSKEQPWHNSAFEADGSLREDYLKRMAKVLDRADELGMAPIVGYFYFGQEPRFSDEAAIVKAAENATDWLLSRGYTNVVVEIANECDVNRYKHEIIKPRRAHELIRLVQERSKGKINNPAGRLLVSTSFKGNTVPTDNVAAAADFLLIHGNGVNRPARIREMVQQCRKLPGYRGQPVLFNEDDHFDFDRADNNMLAAIDSYASWGYFDFRMKGEGFDQGYQSVPVNWRISSDRKRGFFTLLKEITGGGR